MCGIAGIVDFERAPSRELIEAMTARLVHRGPDHNGVHLDGPVALGHTRLSIIDLSQAANQPMKSRNGRFALSYNGEVYNYRQLRRLLRDRGWVFTTDSDSEVVMAAMAVYGPEGLQRLNGMFAFALWDQREQVLRLARDRFGIKPLYYSWNQRRLLFASEIKALLAVPDLPRVLDWQAMHEYLYYGNSLGPGTFFQDIRELPPGHWLEIRASGLTTHRYFAIGDSISPISDGDSAITQVRSAVEKAVVRHMVADVPVGVLLSGGIDSSAITAFAAGHTTGRLQTFSIAFTADTAQSELPMAALVARRFGTDHTELRVEARDLFATLRALLEAHDEPFADSANLPLYLASQQIKGSIKVVLQGDGGDEMFAGYRRYAWLLRAGRLRPLLALAGAAGKLLPARPLTQRALRFAQALAQPSPAMQMALLLTVETESHPPTRILNAKSRARLEGTDPFRRYRECAWAFGHLDPVQRQLYTDCSVILPDTFLKKVDRATMANSVEVRVPFLDTELATLALAVDGRIKVRGGQQKWLLREALRGVVPDEVLDAPKRGFGVPINDWLRNELAAPLREVLFDPSVQSLGWFDNDAIDIALVEHQAGHANHGFLLYKALQLALWAQHYNLS